ncbi:MAG: sugar transferase, partial [Clostridia bacterium]|nr:sugar transferase [Clostridia bacterium]
MYAKFFKRLIDFVLSFIALIVLSPILLILTIIGAIVMKGNPFFIQKRPGMIDKKTGQERILSLVKFRTMTNERDSEGNLLPDEKRLVPYGKFLRSTSLDEIPSIINIVVGSCSLVGPRPLLVSYLTRYSPEQRRRHEVRPGLTGYAQAYGRNSLTWEEKFEKDIYYVDHISLWLDIKIIFKTVAVVLKREGISSETSATMEEFFGSEASTEQEQSTKT